MGSLRKKLEESNIDYTLIKVLKNLENEDSRK